MEIYMKPQAEIAPHLYYAGVDDLDVDLFEGQYVLPDGISYNSYVLLDDKIVIFDTTDAYFVEEWLENIAAILNGKKPDYLIVNHMEPDHSSGIAALAERYPEMEIIGNTKTFSYMEQFLGQSFEKKRIVSDGDTLDTGHHKLVFVFAPMVHWPEVMITYDAATGALFSADGFGRFGALNKIADKTDESWDNEARRYYIGIVGKYGTQTSQLLKKAATLDIKSIYPLHGPALTAESISHAVSLYQKWSSYQPETDDILIAYACVYGHTAAAACRLGELIEENGGHYRIIDLCRFDWAEAVALAFKHSRLVLAATTYNMEVFPAMRTFLENLIERNWQSRFVGLIENGTWAPAAAKVMQAKLEKAKNLSFASPIVTIKSALNPASEEKLKELAKAMTKA